MGNCLFAGEAAGVTRVLKSNGGIMEFSAPITAGCIADQFPGHALFPSHDLFWRPLAADDPLLPGNSYYLLPLTGAKSGDQQPIREGHVRSQSLQLPISCSSSSSSAVTPYRISFDYHGMLKRSKTDFGFSSSRFGGNKGFWKVKLVITPEQLVAILSQDAETLDFVENMRAVANCGNGVLCSSSSVASSVSDQWSFSSSRNGSKKDVNLLDI